MKILFEDNDILVCVKPAGLATQSARTSEPDLVSMLKKHLKEKGEKTPYLGIVHRLDQPVEGLLVFAKSSEAAKKLSAQLTGGTLNKKYYATVFGKPAEKEKTLTDYICKDGNRAVISDRQSVEAKKAILHFQILEEGPKVQECEKWGKEDCEVLEVAIETGRFHQIRAQLSHAGYPILGDQKYGTAESLSFARKKHISQLLLCAYHLEFTHPRTGKRMEFRLE